MAKFKEGDRVLVEAVVVNRMGAWTQVKILKTGRSPGHIQSQAVHPHPADEHNRAVELRRSREAAQRPKYQPGDRVWVPATVARHDRYGVVIDYQHLATAKEWSGVVHPDDIRPVEEDT